MSRFLHQLITASALAAGTLASVPGALLAADDAPKSKEGADRKPEAGERKPDGDRKPDEARKPDAERKPEGARRPEGDDAPRPELGDLFRKLDSDGDGQISADDVPEEHKRLFDRLVGENDKNKDGKLSLDEFRTGLMADRRRAEEGAEGRGPEGAPRGPEGAPRPDGAPRGPARGIEPGEIFKRMDRNNDGKVTKDDAPPEGGERFQYFLNRADADKDGTVTEEEFRKSFQPPRDGGPQGGPREGRPGQPGQPREGGPDRPREGNPGPGNAGPGNPGPGGPRFGGGMGFPGSPVMAALDTNKDGELSADEITAAGSELRKLDKDGDGKLSRQEILPRFEGGPREGMARGEGRPDGQPRDGQPGGPRPGGDFFRSRDTNGDGRISREEAPEKLKENFERIDGNKDGFIDPAELGQMFGGQGRPDGARRPEGVGRPDGGPDGARREVGPEQREEIVRAAKERFQAADKNGDGKLSREELPEQAREHFAKLDQNGDGGIDPAEMREAGRVLGRRDVDRKSEGKPDGESRPPRDADEPKKDGEKKDGEKKETRREERTKEGGDKDRAEKSEKKDDAPKKDDDDKKKDDAPKNDDDKKKDDAPSK